MGKHALPVDPNLPAEGDYPTDEIDVWPLLAEGPPPANVVVDDNGAHHDKRNGRFTRKAKPAEARPVRPTVTKRFGEGEDAPTMTIRVFTWAEVQAMNPDDPNGPNIFEMPDEPGVEWETREFAPGVYSCKPTDSDNFHAVRPVRKRREPTAADIRFWARRNGFTIGAAGAIPARVREAYDKAHAE